MVYDLCIVGGGPGGTAAATTAAHQGLRALLLDKDSFPRHKVCGEFVSFESLALLSSLVEAKINAVAIEAVRLFRDGRVWESPLPARGLSVSRHELDRIMLDAAVAAGVEVRTQTRVRKVNRIHDSFEIDTGRTTFVAKHVINAAGRWSELRSNRSLSEPRWIGVKQHFRETDAPPSTDLYFFPGGYCGVQPIGDGLINACALVQANAAASLAEVLRCSSELKSRAQDWVPSSDPIATAPIVFGPPQPVIDGMYNIGDAAAFIDPFLGDGISIALQTGVLAAECVVRGGVAHYESEYRRRVTPALKRAAVLRRASSSSIAWFVLQWPGTIRMAARLTRVKAA